MARLLAEGEALVEVGVMGLRAPDGSITENVKLFRIVSARDVSPKTGNALLRGLRAFSDFEYELQMALMNRNLRRGCETIFMTPTLKNSFVSSSLVKEIAKYGGDLENYVPAPVLEAIRNRK